MLPKRDNFNSIDAVPAHPLSSLEPESGTFFSSKVGAKKAESICVSDIRTAVQIADSGKRLIHSCFLNAEGNPLPDQLLVSVKKAQVFEFQKLASQGEAVVPMFAGRYDWLIAISSKALAKIKNKDGIGRVDFPGSFESRDFYLMRDMELQGEGFTNGLEAFFDNRAEVLTHLSEGIIVTIPAAASIDDFHFENTHHGHNLKLIADPSLFKCLEQFDAPAFAAVAPLDADLALMKSSINESEIAKIVSELSGAEESSFGWIESRHVGHDHCARALDLIRAKFREAGLNPIDHFFFHEGQRLPNIYADIPGETDAMVLVTAHLDSTAGRNEPHYHPGRDPAPGADDDASGVAAVLALASVLAQSDASHRATIRFALFHAEEHGLVGSRHFARAAAALDHDIEAVLQMDMIGFRPDPNEKRVEIHYGFAASQAIEQLSGGVAVSLKTCAQLLGDFDVIEVYHSPNDPADGRSDHSSFQMSGYPAAIISEDFFAGPVHAPAGPPNNPQYHSQTDTTIDADYAASIARVVGLSALTLSR